MGGGAVGQASERFDGFGIFERPLAKPAGGYYTTSMRNFRLLKLLALPLLALLLSCSKKEKDRLLTGTLPTDSTVYGQVSVAQKSDSPSTPPLSQKILVRSGDISQLPDDEIQLAKFTIKSIEFSADEVNWIPILDTPLDIEAKIPYLNVNFNKINVGPFLVPAGNYKAIRIKLAPGVTVLNTLSGEPYPFTLNDFPQMIISVGTYNWDNGILEEIILNQSNDRSQISPFDIQAGNDSHLLFEVYFLVPSSNKSQWALWWRSVRVSDAP